MELELIQDKVYCKIYDKTYNGSSGIYSLHKYSDAAKLLEIKSNRASIKSNLGAKHVVFLKQVHGNKVICADSIDYTQPLEGDAHITTHNNIALAINTADCVPVLFASEDGAVIGAAHCGWRSVKAGIINNMQAMMKMRNSRNIKAIIGPAIAQESYEVDMNYYKEFINMNVEYKELFIPSKNKNHFMFDLVGLVKKQLLQLGIEIVHIINEDTYVMPEKYPSYRRASHQGRQHTQNILSTIIIK
ncbi:MAG: peptidoglycan editing factor PgeF [Rickettsiaceae bacterium]